MTSRLSSSGLARGAARHPWRTLGLWGLALAAAVAAIVTILPGALTAQYSFLGNPDSQVGRDLLAERMDMPIKANEAIIVRSASTTAEDPAFKAFVLGLQKDIAALGPGVVDSVGSAWKGGDKTLIAADGRTTILPVVMAWRHDTELYLQRVAKVQWGLMLSVYCVSHAPAIATLEPPGHEGRGPLLLLYFLLIVQMFDMFAVMASASFGRTPLRSNPNKSREGVFIGGAAATALGTLLWWMTPFAWWQAALISAATVFAAFMGGLVLASVKRSLGERQWDQSVALSRGVLERLEGITFSAPVFFHVTVYFFVP